MSSLITTLLVVGLLVGGAYVLINPERRCNYLGICGGAGTTATGGGGGAVSGADTTASTSGCCTCEKRDGTMKCKVNDDVIIDEPGQTTGWFDIFMPKELQNLPNAIEVAQDACDTAGECYEGADDGGGSSNGGGGGGSGSSKKGKTISSGTRNSTKSTTAKTGSQGNPGAEKKGVKNKNSSVVGSGQKISSSFKFGGFANAYLTGDGRYAYYPTASSNYTGYKRYPYYVRGNRIYSLPTGFIAPEAGS